MPRPFKFTMVGDRREPATELHAPHPYRLCLPRPMMIGGTLLFWAAVILTIKLLAS